VTILRLRPEALQWREIEGEVVAVDLETSSYLGANAAGAVLWRSLAVGATKEELVALLVAEFGIDAKQAAADTDAFLAQLRESGLLAE
jgi:hypothetical protein